MDTIKHLWTPSLSSQPSPLPGAGSAPLPVAAAEAVAPPVDWRAFYARLLELEGYKPSIDDDGDLRFKHENWHLCLNRDARDAEYFRLILPNFWSLDGDAERVRAERAADRVNRQMKVAKVHSAAGRSMWATVEMFVAEPGHAAPVLMRCIRILPEAALLFRAVMATLDS